MGGPQPRQGRAVDVQAAGAPRPVGPVAGAAARVAEQVAGRAELIDVVTAISSAEASLETVMAVRDQVIQAYQEIMRMPI